MVLLKLQKIENRLKQHDDILRFTLNELFKVKVAQNKIQGV